MNLDILINSFPAFFGLRGYPGAIFRLNVRMMSSFHPINPGEPVFYIQRQLIDEDGQSWATAETNMPPFSDNYRIGDWLIHEESFTEAHLRRELVPLPPLEHVSISAEVIRRALKQAHPNVYFSVRAILLNGHETIQVEYDDERTPKHSVATVIEKQRVGRTLAYAVEVFVDKSQPGE